MSTQWADPVEEARLGLAEAGSVLNREDIEREDLHGGERALLHALGNVRRAKDGDSA